MLRELMKLSPHVVKTIWGGERLSKIKQLGLTHKVGETWELSALTKGPSLFEGKSINDVVAGIKREVWGDAEELKYLVKFIETAENLSVQVHPHDEYAECVEHCLGKTECWLILDAAPGAGIYLGLNQGVTRRDFSKALERKEDMSQFLRFYPVRPGDFFYVPAGTTHAIGAGVFLIEVQESSDITYRVWDWNRVDDKGNSRELHIDKALEVICFDPHFNRDENFKIKKDVFQSAPNGMTLLEHKDFCVDYVAMKADTSRLFELTDMGRARAIVCLEGELSVTRGECEECLFPYQTLLIPYRGVGCIVVEAQTDCKFVLVS